ncbi:MAG TPA: LLM class F420-dependent oxidoreductase [Acidimicrobiales bacterium]|nr:LLM class F420-dependent oxidoreductase [Acidimicrobiales bacterium]
MKYGIVFANTMQWTKGPGAAEMARAADDAGFESLWTVEHVVYPDDYSSPYPYSPDGKMPAVPSTPIPDPLIWLAYVAGVTTSIRLATGILILPQRNPVVLAKELATLDEMSGGRVELGIGVGWLREEFDALGIPWEQRGARTDEYVAAMRALWASDGATYEGDFAAFTRVSSNPKPAQGTIPIVVGGHSRAACERAGRLGDGLFPGKGTPAELREMVDIVRQTAAGCGRDPEAIEVTAGSPAIFGDDPVGAAQELAEIGVRRIVVPAFLLRKPSERDAMAAFAERVIAPTASV